MMMIWKIQRTTAIPIQNKPLYEFLYAKNDRFGFTEEQDIEILRKLYPDARKIKVIYSVPGESHFVITNW